MTFTCQAAVEDGIQKRLARAVRVRIRATPPQQRVGRLKTNGDGRMHDALLHVTYIHRVG